MKRLLLYTEAAGAGVLSAIENTCFSLSDDFEITFLYTHREETPSIEKLKHRLTRKVTLIPVHSKVKMFILIKQFIVLICLLYREKPDVFHMHSTFAGFIGRIALIFYIKPIKSFYSPHCYAFKRKDISIIKRKVYFFVESLLAKISKTSTICVSMHELQIANKISSQKNYLVYNTLIQEKTILNHLSHMRKDGKELLIGTTGRVTEQKNPLLFIDIAKTSISINKLKHRFIWIGGGSNLWEAKVKKELDGFEGKIDFSGWLERNSVLKLFQSIDIYIHTALWEAMPISFLEAMICKKPIIALKFDGIEELIVNNYNGFICKDYSEFIDKLSLLMNNLEMINQMGENSYNYYFANFSSEKIITKLREIYSENED